jgi:hypothetical protein
LAVLFNALVLETSFPALSFLLYYYTMLKGESFMSRQFSFGTVFRMIEKSLLRSFFESFDADVNQVPWDKLKRNEIDVLLKLFDELSPDKRNQAEVVLRDVHALACENGVHALGEAADELLADESWGTMYLSDNNLYTKALSAWLTHREIFEHAIQFFAIDTLTWWRKRVGLPKRPPSFDDNVCLELEDELEQFFRVKQGRGFVCTVEMFARSNGTFYFFAYPDDYVQDVYVHDNDGVLVPHTTRHTFEIVFAYDSIDGTSDLSAKLSAKLREELESIFLKHLLKTTPSSNEKQPYDLSMLLNPEFTLHTQPDEHVYVHVVSLTLAWDNDKEITFTSKRSHSARELALDSVKLTMPLQSAVVRKAKFRFEFWNPATNKSKTLTFEIGVPFLCTLKNQQPSLVEKALYYLKQWRIENVQTERCESTENVAEQVALR